MRAPRLAGQPPRLVQGETCYPARLTPTNAPEDRTHDRCPFAAALLAVAASAALAELAVVYDMGGKSSTSRSTRWWRTTAPSAGRRKPARTREELAPGDQQPGQREQAMRRMAERGARPSGRRLAQGSSMEKVAGRLRSCSSPSSTRWSTCPTQSIVFKEHEGSFLVGMMAAIASKSGKVSFVGGMDIPLIRKFQCGFEQGAKYANPKVEVSANMTGTTPTAWNDPGARRRAGQGAVRQGRGRDLSPPAAPAWACTRPPGRRQAGHRRDSNQNHLQPGTMLTSMVKRVDVAVFNAFKGHHARRHQRWA